MLTINECQNCEINILGSILKEEIHSTLLSSYTGGRCRSVRNWRNDCGFYDIERYEKSLINLFNNTKDIFDWTKKTADVIDSNENIEESRLTEDFMRICIESDELQKKKGVHYGNSWRKRGMVGVFHNLARKFDRIENIIERAAIGNSLDPTKLPRGEESLRETLRDLFVYSGKAITLLDAMGLEGDEVDVEQSEKN